MPFSKKILIVGGGTSGAVLAARLSERPDWHITLLEAGPDHDAYDSAVLDPARAADAWEGAVPIAPVLMHTDASPIPIFQGRILGGTSAVNGLATLRGLPSDYDGWNASGLEGWGWSDVRHTFIAAERDSDFGRTALHGDQGPLPVRRWRPEEMSRAQLAFREGMMELGENAVSDINDPSQLPGVGVFPVTIDEFGQRVSTSLAYLTESVRERENLTIRTSSEVARVHISSGIARGVLLTSGEEIEADEVVLTAGALWTPAILMRSGVGPRAHLREHGIEVRADLPVGETLSDHLGPCIPYQHEGERGGVAGPAQVLLVGASNGRDIDYHTFPIAPAPCDDQTVFMMAVFLMRSAGQGKVRLGASPEEPPAVIAPSLPNNAHQVIRHAFDRIARWEQSNAAKALGCKPVEPHDLMAEDAVEKAIETLMLSYGHMTSTCPMGAVLDSDCRVLGVEGLRIADASVMPTIPAGNTYLGCVMIAERIATKMKSLHAA